MYTKNTGNDYPSSSNFRGVHMADQSGNDYPSCLTSVEFTWLSKRACLIVGSELQRNIFSILCEIFMNIYYWAVPRVTSKPITTFSAPMLKDTSKLLRQ